MSLMATIMDTFAARIVTWEKKITTKRKRCRSGKLEKPNRRNALTVV